MERKNNNPEGSNRDASTYYDLSEESSKRPNGATEQARSEESDDINEESSIGPVSTPKGDNWAENKVATSLDDE